MINAVRAGLVALMLAIGLIAVQSSKADSQPDELLPGQIAIVKAGKLAKFVAKSASPSGFSLPDASNDPSANGGTLHFFDTVARASADFTFPLPAGAGWSRIGSPSNVKGYKYKGAGTAGDPCVVVLIKPKIVKAVCKGSAVGFTLPFDGDLGVVLTVGSAKRYCADFGGASNGNPATVFKHKAAPAPGTCPSDATATPNPTGTPTPADTPTDTPAPTATATGVVAANPLISEVRTRGIGGAADEFVELYNPSGTSIVLDATWTLEARSTSATSYTLRWTGSGAVLPAHGHYLIAGTGYSQVPSTDASLSSGIPDGVSLVLEHSAAAVDALCLYFDPTGLSAFTGAGSTYTCEGTPTSNPHDNTSSTDVDASVERKPGGLNGNGQDTGDNATDFSTAMPANPQDLASPPTP